MSQQLKAGFWAQLRAFTDARVALGRTGASLPTDELLKFSYAHAKARDAVWQPFDAAKLANELENEGWQTLIAHSAAKDRETYLLRPDLGRCLAAQSAQMLTLQAQEGVDLLLVVADGLSSNAVERQVKPLLSGLKPYLEQLRLTLAPVVLAQHARVALGDEIAACLHAKAVVVLIGERPGLSAPDSLGAYITWQPQRGCSDAQRNCISNIRPEGLGYQQAAFKLAWLLEQAFVRRLTGVELKDESDNWALAKPLDSVLSVK